LTDRGDEERLWAEIRSGGAARSEALRALFESLRRPLFGLALRMTGRADLADDAVQDAFVDVLRGIDGFRGEARLTTWTYRVLVRAATRIAATRSSRQEPLPEELAGPAEDPRETLAQREGAARLLEALQRLPAPQRAVLSLAALEDLPRTEIAAVLGIPEGTVHSRLHAAREALRSVLAGGRN